MNAPVHNACERGAIPMEHGRPRVCGRSASAFTLIEVVVVMALIALIIGISAMSLSSVNAERRIMEPGVKLKKYARDALRLALATQRSYSIEMHNTYFVLRETNVREEDMEDWEEKRRQQARETKLDNLYGDEEPKGPVQRIIERYNLPEGTQVQWKRWLDKHFVDIEPEQGAVWQFDASGICEPVGIRFLGDEGFIEMIFNPLTAKVQDERLIVDENWEDAL
jgi:prepilin-type N-terminal cleavage/methylation domain-containing protein